ncbi:uncharacterized protein ACA1_367250 [Acanthamoeba castellanii str. Neff]|uniref:HAUS augmin-like complex subunit 6 N-terminal domain-containing protein n=1 Tax=Acanthamoeba castellanii (strain ATCC 30010 / Neff) TaxID=1257118 RepID=L8GMA3_ACACF|nr:uncharacterized protein ACA1_367250 [Acanthamoeba castellanii str. Neff]ELR14092.1 hypothetical protein ACA1_367250 [Acanthamoeba castellanii str. Neff]
MDTTLALPDEENKENVVGRESRRILKTAVSPKDIWWANMLLLGFCPIENEKVYAVSFHPDMFEQASTKGMQVVLYYLLRQINRDKTKKAFKGCWPTLDMKNNLNDYKKAANNLITELEHDGEIPAGTFRLSHLQSVGTRFYTLLWHLSVAAIRGALVKKYPSAAPPQKRLIDAGTYKLAGVIAKAPKHLIERQRQRFLSHAQAVVAVQGEWRTCARDLENEYRSLTQQMQTHNLQNKLKEERKRLAGFEKKSEDYINKRQKKIEQIKRVWGLFSKYHEENTANRDMLDNIASGKSSKLALNQADMYSDLASLRQQLLSSSMCSPVSPATAQAASTAVQTLSYQECQLLLSVNPLRDDQLDLLTLIKLWNLSLSIVKKRIESNHLLERSHAGSQLTEDAPMLTNLLDAHQNRLSALSAFNNSLNEELPALQEQTTELRKLFPPEPSITVPATPSRRPLGLQTPSRGSADASTGFELLPPTPDLALEKCLDEAQDETADMPAQVGATPLPKREDQERMVDSIHRAAKQRRPRLSIGSGRAAGTCEFVPELLLWCVHSPSSADPSTHSRRLDRGDEEGDVLAQQADRRGQGLAERRRRALVAA